MSETEERQPAAAPPYGANLLPPQRSSATLYGRDVEVEQLDAVFLRAVDYRTPQLVTVVGAAGIGKSRLLDEWISRLLGRYVVGLPGRPRVYRSRALPGAGSYSLLGRLLRDRFELKDGEDPEARFERVQLQLTEVFGDHRLTEVIHYLGRFLDLRLPDNAFFRAVSSREGSRGEEFLARTILRRFLELDAERSPLVIAFDDLHLGDDDSVTLLGELAEGLGGSPVVIVAATRPELFVRYPAFGRSPVDHTRIELGSLPASETERLLRNLLEKADPLPRTLVEDACELTRGNPFFIEELVRVFFESGTITAHGDRWRVDVKKAATVRLPMSVEAAIQARISTLSPFERRLLERAATLGSVFWVGALVVLGRCDEEYPLPAAELQFGVEERMRIESALEELVERDYVLKMPDSTLASESEYIFKHNLEHDLVLQLLPTERARRYYRAAAEWLDLKLSRQPAHSGEQLEYLASLFERGGDAARASQAYLNAADKARSRFAYEAAVELYEKGLRLLSPEAALQRLDVLHDHGDVLARTGHVELALAAFQEMLRCSWRLDLPAKGGAALARMARVRRGLGEYDLAEADLHRALGLFRSAGDGRGIAAAEDQLGRVAFLRGAFPNALDRHGQALDLRRALGDARSIALSLHNLAAVHQAMGAHGEAMARFSEALALRRQVGDRQGEVESLLSLADVWRDRGDLRRSYDVLSEALSLAQQIASRLDEAQILMRLGEALAEQGRAEEAEDPLGRAAMLAAAFGDRLLEAEAARLAADVKLRLGEMRRARDDARRALELSQKVGAAVAIGISHRVLGRVLAHGGTAETDRTEADHHLTRAVEVLGKAGAERELWRALETAAQVSMARGDSVEAESFRERARVLQARLGASALLLASGQP